CVFVVRWYTLVIIFKLFRPITLTNSALTQPSGRDQNTTLLVHHIFGRGDSKLWAGDLHVIRGVQLSSVGRDQLVWYFFDDGQPAILAIGMFRPLYLFSDIVLI
ncbi:MAG: hypothetical protein ACKPKO_03045, partial [Candidatus Fonsibacter sp.]